MSIFEQSFLLSAGKACLSFSTCKMRQSSFALLAIPSGLALEWPGPTPTPHGLMAQAGISPRPTAPPELRGLPRALMRRQNSQLPNPPPASWCGFVTGDPGKLLGLKLILQKSLLIVLQPSLLNATLVKNASTSVEP